MRYLGGKYRIAKKISEQINLLRRPGQPVWDAFCGGLSVGAAIGKPVVCTDINEDLIALYQAVAAGWDPPKEVSKDLYRALKDSPPSPLRTFAGFGCSFGGLWFSSWAAPRSAVKGGPLYSMAASSRASLLKDVPKVSKFACTSFMDISPEPKDIIIYCDPPYRGTAGYSAVGAFDHDAFNARVLEWAGFGVPVFVSEYSFPHGKEVWSAGRSNRSSCFATQPERLFLVTA